MGAEAAESLARVMLELATELVVRLVELDVVIVVGCAWAANRIPPQTSRRMAMPAMRAGKLENPIRNYPSRSLGMGRVTRRCVTLALSQRTTSSLSSLHTKE